MTEAITLAATKRDDSKNSARDARDDNRVPGVLYGKGIESVSLSVDASDLIRAYRKVGQGENAGAEFTLDLDGKKHKVVMHDAYVHPVRHELHHIDFKLA